MSENVYDIYKVPQTHIMVPAHFHDVDGELSDPNFRKIFQLSKILTVILRHRALLVF